MMHAIYEGRVFRLGDDLNDCLLLDRETGAEVRRVPYGAPTLIVDPTDAQVEAAEQGRPIPPASCAVCSAHPRHEGEWNYYTGDGYGVCDDCGRAAADGIVQKEHLLG
jgi:hypothetical protein